jgi:CRP-like cAMP-binding protein
MAKAEVLCPDCKQKSTCFRQLDEGQLQITNKSKVQIRYKKGETIIKQGSFVTHVLYIREGLAKLYKEHDDGSSLIYSILPAGTLVGLTNLFTHETFGFSVAALSHATVCSIDRDVVEQLISENGSFARSVIEALNNETRNLRSKLVSLTHKPLRGRLADTLIHLARDVFESEEFPYKLSRNDLAEFSGMSMMSMVRTIQGFMKEGHIRELDGKLQVLDMAALERIRLENK